VLLALGAARIFGWRVMMLQAFRPTGHILGGTLVVVIACVVASSFLRCGPRASIPMTDACAPD
jgi:hypothetical protein